MLPCRKESCELVYLSDSLYDVTCQGTLTINILISMQDGVYVWKNDNSFKYHTWWVGQKILLPRQYAQIIIIVRTFFWFLFVFRVILHESNSSVHICQLQMSNSVLFTHKNDTKNKKILHCRNNSKIKYQSRRKMQNRNPSIQIHDCSLSCLGGSVKLVWLSLRVSLTFIYGPNVKLKENEKLCI